ncbi:MAG TPA: DMT family transporter [Xanthobacteraceae bacterium]|nr:DMT family transporter [Xanthobacteraceae bacterium]
MNVVRAVVLKLLSTVAFALMGACIRFATQTVPIGEVVFFRGAFAILPVVVVYAFRGELRSAVRMARPREHVGRGLLSAFAMYLNFTSLALLPLADATAISFTSPLITVVLAVVLLKEKVMAYRWVAMAVGFSGVLIMLAPHLFHGGLTASQLMLAGSGMGAAAGLGAALGNAATTIQTRRMTQTETTSAIVFYFSLFCAIWGLATLPFGWKVPTLSEWPALVALGVLGGLGHIVLTESYRLAPASVIAPFDYVAMIWAVILGYLAFSEVPGVLVLAGAAVVVGANLYVIWRERKAAAPRRPAGR